MSLIASSFSSRSLTIGAVVALTLAACGDDTAPELTLIGAETITLEFGDTFTDPGVTVTDDKDEDLEVVVTGTVDTQALGDYTLTYTAIDEAGNAAVGLTRTVSVVDTTKPVITLTGDAELTIDEGDTFTDPGAVVIDAADPDVELVVTGTVDADTSGEYTLTYSAIDASGNVADPVLRTVEVVFDGQLAIVSNGSELLLMGLKADGTLVQRASASLPGTEDYNPNYMMFGLAQDPTTGLVYASSFNDCGTYDSPLNGCWGNARIDRYSFDVNGITHEGLAYLAQHPLRLLTPTYDEGAGTLTTVLLNQGDASIPITGVTDTALPNGVTLSSPCAGTTLMAGDSCNIVIDTPSNLTGTVSFDVETALGTLSAQARYNTEIEAHLVLDDGFRWTEEPAAPRCSAEGFSYPNQVGGCAITALAISQDGSRMYVNEDNDDIGLVFSIEADGTLGFLSASTDRMSLQGIAVHPDNTAVYNGTNAYSVAGGTTLTRTFSGQGGNATEVITFGGTDMLVTTNRNSTLDVLDLTDPLLPLPITSLATSFAGARFQHHNADSSLFVVIDLEDIATVSFNGALLTELSTLNAPIDVGECEGCSWRGGTRIVQVTPDGSHAITGGFVAPDDAETGAQIPFRGLLRAYSINAGDGALTETDAIELPGTTRAMIMVSAPE